MLNNNDNDDNDDDDGDDGDGEDSDDDDGSAKVGMFVSPQNSYVEIVTTKVMVLGGVVPLRGDYVKRVEPS